jgi:uncharacterized protein
MIVDGDGLTLLNEDECRTRMAVALPRVGRIAFVHDGYPIVLPVNYDLLDGEVVFRTGLGSKLEAALLGMPVSFQVDQLDPSWEEGWSVLVKGKAEELTGGERVRASRLALRPWGPGRKPRYLRIRAAEITGRQIS